MYSVAQQQQQQQQQYSFQRFESDRTVEETKPVRVVHAQFNSPINLYSQEKIAERLNQVLTQDSYQSVASGSSPNIAQHWNPQKDKYVSSDPWKKAPLPPPKPKPGVQFQPQSHESFSRQDSVTKSSVDSSRVQQSFGNQQKFGTTYRQASQEVLEEYTTEDYSNQDFEYLPPPVTDNRVFGVTASSPRASEKVRDPRVFGANYKAPAPMPARDTRVFAANYNREQTTPRPEAGVQRQVSNQEFQVRSETDETSSRMVSTQSHVQQQQVNQQFIDKRQVNDNQERQEIEEKRRRQFEEQQRRFLESEQRRLEEERMSQASPNQSEGEPKFIGLHQGSVVQFPSKLPDPKHKLPDGSHLGEEKNMVQLHPGGMCQFISHIPDPSQKLVEGSHLREERENIHLHGGTVCQFPTEVPDHHKLPDAPHIKDLEDLEHLHLKQGSVVQFPKEIRETKMNGFHPPREAMEENLPQADSVKYNQLLPSEARRQQAYLVHPCQHPFKMLSEVSSAPGSPSAGRRARQEWPPRRSSHDRSVSPFIIPEGGKKSFVWPPPKPEFHRSLQELPPPDAGHGPAADVWHPQERMAPRSYRQPMISRKKSVWPPPSPRLVKQSSLPESDLAGRRIEFEEHFLYHAGENVPVCYRPPPGTQFYNPYEDE